jgi:membrane-associated protease RseP (regulator of RpoE activity)
MLNGIAVFIMLSMMFMWCGSKWRKRLVGFGLLTDITIHVLLQAFLGGDGEGRLAVLFGGVMFNLALMFYRKVRGYSSFEDGQWVMHGGWFYRPRVTVRA